MAFYSYKVLLWNYHHVYCFEYYDTEQEIGLTEGLLIASLGT